MFTYLTDCSQACMLVDIFCGTKILSEWAVVWLGLPILGHSGANPWIYAFHHGEMRVAATKIAEDVVTRFGIHPSRYGCSPIRRGSNTNLELAEVNKSSEARRPPVEDCFAAKHQSPFQVKEKIRCPGERTASKTDISPEGVDSRRRFSAGSLSGDIVEEDIHDLTNMLRPEYAIDRNLLIDSNHNVNKIQNFKYLLDPTFNKIRNLRLLNTKRSSSKPSRRVDEPKFISYQNLKSDDGGHRKIQLNTMSDPVLNAESPGGEGDEDLSEILCRDPVLCRRRNSNLASMSDPNIKATNVSGGSSKIYRGRDNVNDDVHRYSVQSLDNARHTIHCRMIDNLKRSNCRRRGTSLGTSDYESTCRDMQIRENSRIAGRVSPNKFKYPIMQITLTTNKLANLFGADHERMQSVRESVVEGPPLRPTMARQNSESIKHSESICGIQQTTRSGLLEPSRFMDSLMVPTIHSEPPSPIDPLPLGSLKEEEPPSRIHRHHQSNTNRQSSPMSRNSSNPVMESSLPSPTTPAETTIPFVLLNVEDFSAPCDDPNPEIQLENVCRPICVNKEDSTANVQLSITPEELAEALLMSSERRPSGTIFAEHDSTRFSSRRPSDLRWSESSRSQEVLSNFSEHQKSPSSYSVNNFQTCTSGSDLNDVTCLGSFMCPDPLTSSLRESFFEAPSVPDSDVFTSLEDLENQDVYSPEPTGMVSVLPMVHSSVSSANLERTKPKNADVEINQSKSSESVMKNYHAIMRLASSVHPSRFRVRPGQDCIINDPPVKRNSTLAPLATPTPMEICTPTFDTAAEIKGAAGVGVRV